jgi:hypothetical protein
MTLPANPAPLACFEGTEARVMECPKNAVEFVTEWWELSGNIVTTLAALRRLKQAYPSDYLFMFCPRNEIANRAAALQEICAFVEYLARVGQENAASRLAEKIQEGAVDLAGIPTEQLDRTSG